MNVESENDNRAALQRPAKTLSAEEIVSFDSLELETYPLMTYIWQVANTVFGLSDALLTQA